MPDGPTIIDSDGTVRRGRSVPAGIGHDFAIGTPDMTSIAVSHQTVLVFGEVAVVIESSFELHVEGATHHLDPFRREDLGPLLGLYPDGLSTLVADGDGTLRLGFASGAELVVPASAAPYEAWEVRGPGDALVVCTAGGEGQLAVWT